MSTSRVYALWNGGAGYRQSSVYDGDTEVFPSIRAAADALVDRAKYGDWQPQDFAYADGRTARSLTPGADEGCEMHVFLYDPREADDPYPDRVVSIGPRGGVRIERA